MVVDPSSDFFKYLKSPAGAADAGARAAALGREPRGWSQMAASLWTAFALVLRARGRAAVSGCRALARRLPPR